jgi:branched-chain amino acid transport system permease protein
VIGGNTLSPSRPWRHRGLHHLRGGGGGRHGLAGGAFLASLLIGVMQTFAVALDYSLIHAVRQMGVASVSRGPPATLLKLTVSQVAPILPYLFLVLILIFRPKGLLGTRED